MFIYRLYNTLLYLFIESGRSSVYTLTYRSVNNHTNNTTDDRSIVIVHRNSAV